MFTQILCKEKQFTYTLYNIRNANICQRTQFFSATFNIYSLLVITAVVNRRKDGKEGMTSDNSLGNSAAHLEYKFPLFDSTTNFPLISI